MQYIKMVKIIRWIGVVFLILVLALVLMGCSGVQRYNSPAMGDPATGAIIGNVKDEADVAIIGATIIVEEAGLSATTDEDGYYLLEDIPVGTYTIDAPADNYYPQTASVTIEQYEIVTQDFIQLSIPPAIEAYTLSGTVTDKDMDEPLGGAMVTIEGHGWWYATTDDNGSYSISDVVAGTYNITASKLGYTDQTEAVGVNGDTTIDFELMALEYDLTIDSTDGVSVTTPGKGTFTYEDGTVVELVAEADDGYQFVKWAGDVGTIADVGAAATNITMSGNYSITAKSAAVYDLTISSTEGGLVTTPGDCSFIYESGTVVDLVAEADYGYQFVEWTGDVGTIANVKSAATNITMNGDYSITADFVKQQYDLTISSTEGGSVTTPGDCNFIYESGTVVDLVAEADNDYQFVEWTGDVGTITNVKSATTNITMNGDYSITAEFVRQYNLTISSTEGGSVTTPGKGIFTYDAGTVVNLVATPDDGYQFVEWTSDVSTIANVESAATTITMNGDYSITAEFVKQQYDLTISSTEGGSVTTPGEGTFTYDAGMVVDLVATPDDGYRFVQWTGDVSTIGDVTAATTTITISGDYSITAEFVKQQYDLTISSTEGGSVTMPGEGTFTYDTEAVVNLMATPDDGYRFVKWTGDVSTIANVESAATTITISGDYSITAEFVRQQHDLAISSMEGGSVTTPGEGTFTYDAGTVVNLMATPDDGYRFVQWTGDVSTIGDVTAAATTITMSGDYSVTASFAMEDTPVGVDSITYKTEGGKNNDKHLDITVLLLDGLGQPVARASVSATLYRDDGSSWNFQGTTDVHGTVTFKLENHGRGCYWTVVTDVQAEGLKWDGVTPENGYCKK
jgi:hypothetical protein